MPSITLTSPNISCGHCVHTIESELGELPGVRRVQADADSKKVTIDFEAPATIGQIAAVLRDIDYPADEA